MRGPAPSYALYILWSGSCGDALSALMASARRFHQEGLLFYRLVEVGLYMPKQGYKHWVYGVRFFGWCLIVAFVGTIDGDFWASHGRVGTTGKKYDQA